MSGVREALKSFFLLGKAKIKTKPPRSYLLGVVSTLWAVVVRLESGRGLGLLGSVAELLCL